MGCRRVSKKNERHEVCRSVLCWLRYMLRCMLRYLLRLSDFCAHDGVLYSIADDDELTVAEEFLAFVRWAMGVFYRCCGLGSKIAGV